MVAEGQGVLFGRVTALEGLIAQAVPSAVGQMFLAATSAAFPNLDSITWVTITQYDATAPSNPAEAKGVTLDTTAGGIAFKQAGLWRLDLTFSMEHDENVAVRNFDLIVYNITADTYGNLNRIVVYRNQPGINFAVNMLLDVAEANLNQLYGFRLKMAPGSAAMTGISFIELSYIATYVDSFESTGVLG